LTCFSDKGTDQEFQRELCYRERSDPHDERIDRPEDVANSALFLVSDESDFMTGSILLVNGGWTVW
jgi:NAD(P)-dependent dehydrogenase (short-subunit alcohol dehydrogenase family)